jgi:structure-specific recognition protein 1
VSNTNLAGKNEVAVEFALPSNDNDTGTNGHLGGARGKGKKAGAGKDQLVEMRFYIPGVTSKKEDNEGSDADGEELAAANLFYQTLVEKADVGEVAGDTFAGFLDILHLTPRSVTAGVERWTLTDQLQRTFRSRHVRELLPHAWKDIRLQDTI